METTVVGIKEKEKEKERNLVTKIRRKIRKGIAKTWNITRDFQRKKENSKYKRVMMTKRRK